MRAARRLGTFIAASAAIGPAGSAASASSPVAVIEMRAGHHLSSLIQQLRLYKRGPDFDADGDGNDDLDARGKVFSPISVPETIAPNNISSGSSSLRRAAVLVCIFEGELGELRVILTKRSSNLSTHSGEVSLPGGKADEGDADEVETATREAKEEIGLDPSLITVVTVLEAFLSKHLLRVYPVICIILDRQAFKPVLNRHEVDEIFDVPLEMFLKDDNRSSKVGDWFGFYIHYFNYCFGDRKFIIWGLTAAILIRAASVVYQRSPSFPYVYPRFKLSNI